MQDCKDASGLQFIKLEFVTGNEKKLLFLWNFDFVVVILLQDDKASS